MKRAFILLPALAAVLFCLPASAGERGSRALSGWFNVTAENGWRGRRYMDGDQIFAEEFATGASGRIDVWRFYRRGVLTSEERDVNGDGKVDLQTRMDPRNGLLASILRDTNRRGVNDLEIERTSHERWEIREDRNLDGTTDRILFIAAPNDFFDGADLSSQGSVDGLVDRPMRREMWSDDGYTGSITDYFRYNRSGVLTHYGQWDGRKIAWQRCAPDFVPPAASPAPAPATQFTRTPPPAQDPVWNRPPADAEETIRDPFNVAAGAADADPYAGMYAAPPATGMAGDPYSADGGAAFAPDQRTQTPPPQHAPPPQFTPQSGRPRMTALPTDESSARSVPARMRPPGTSVSRRPRL